MPPPPRPSSGYVENDSGPSSPVSAKPRSGSTTTKPIVTPETSAPERVASRPAARPSASSSTTGGTSKEKEPAMKTNADKSQPAKAKPTPKSSGSATTSSATASSTAAKKDSSQPAAARSASTTPTTMTPKHHRGSSVQSLQSSHSRRPSEANAAPTSASAVGLGGALIAPASAVNTAMRSKTGPADGTGGGKGGRAARSSSTLQFEENDGRTASVSSVGSAACSAVVAGAVDADRTGQKKSSPPRSAKANTQRSLSKTSSAALAAATTSVGRDTDSDAELLADPRRGHSPYGSTFDDDVVSTQRVSVAVRIRPTLAVGVNAIEKMQPQAIFRDNETTTSDLGAEKDAAGKSGRDASRSSSSSKQTSVQKGKGKGASPPPSKSSSVAAADAAASSLKVSTPTVSVVIPPPPMPQYGGRPFDVFSPMAPSTGPGQPVPGVPVTPVSKEGVHRYAFDHVFDETDGQAQVYESCIHGPLHVALAQGTDLTVLAYGQTGSGKTHTMLGPATSNAAAPMDVHKAKNGGAGSGRSRSPLSALPADRSMLKESPSSSVAVKQSSSALGGATPSKDRTSGSAFSRTHTSPVSAHHVTVGIPIPSDPSLSPHALRSNQIVDGATPPRSQSSRQQKARGANGKGDAKSAGDRDEFTLGMSPTRAERERSSVESGLTSASGVFPRVIQDVLEFRRQRAPAGVHVTASLQAVEVYNDMLLDLLDTKRPSIAFREAGDEIHLASTSTVDVRDPQCAKRAFALAAQNRTVASTAMNDTSSRSHAVFLIDIHQRLDPSSASTSAAAINTAASTTLNEPTTLDRHDSLGRGSMSSTAFTRSNTAVVSADRDVSVSGVTSRSGVSSSGVGGGGGRVCRTRIMLVDLAGSERIKQSGVKGTQLSEAVHVNKSLSALGSVVLHLCRGSKHIPYRTSTLTRLLRPTLQSGKSRTLFICNVAPTTATAQESLAALNFAHRLKELALPTTTMDADSTPAAMALRSDEERALCERRFELSMLAAELRLATVDTAPKQTSLVDHFHQQQQSTNAEATGDPQASGTGKDGSSPQERLTVAQLRQKFESGTTESVSRSLFDDYGAIQAGGEASTSTAVSPYAGLVGDDEAIAGAIAVTSAVQRLYTDEAKAADAAGSNNVSASASVSVSALSTPQSSALKTPTTPSRTPVMTPGRVAQQQAQAAAETALRESNVTVEERRALRLPLPRGAVSKIVKRGGASATASRASESTLRSSAVSELADELVQEWTRQATESATASSLHGHQTPTPTGRDSEETPASSVPGEGAASSRSTSVGKGVTRRPQTVSTPKSLAAATAVASYKRHLRLVISKTAELEQARAKHTKEVGELESAEVALREAKTNAKTAAGRWDRLLEHRQQQKEAAASLSSPKPPKAKPNGKDGDDDFTPEEVTLAELHELQVELRLRRITLTKERSALDAVGKVIHSDLQNSEAAAKRRLKIEEERATRARVAVQHLQRQNGKDREVGTAAASGSVGAVAASIRAWQREVDTWVLSSLLDAALVRQASETKSSKSKSPDKKPSKKTGDDSTKEGETEQADDEKAVHPMDVEASLKKGTDAISHILATFTHQDKALLPHAHHRGPASAEGSAPSASAAKRKTSADQSNANVGLKPRGPDVEAEAVLMQRPLELPFTVFTHGGSVGGAEKSSSAAAAPESLEGRVRFCLPPRPSLVRQKSAQLDKTRPRPAPVVPTNRRSRKSPKPQTPGAAKEPMVLPRSAAVPVHDAAARAIDALKQRPFSTQDVGASGTEKSGDVSRDVGGGDVLSDTSGTEYSIDEDGTCRRSKERNARPRQAQRRLRRSIVADRSDRSSSVQRRLRQMSRDSIRRSREVRETERINERERAREVAAQEEADRKEAERKRQEEAAAQARAQQEGSVQPGAGGASAAEGDKSPREEEITNKPTAGGGAAGTAGTKEPTAESKGNEKENKEKSKSRPSSSPRHRKPLCLLDGQKTRSVIEPPTPEMSAMVARDLTEKQQQLHRESTVKVLQTLSRVVLKKTLTGQLIQQFSSALDLVMMPCELAPAALAETPARIAPDFTADDLSAIAGIALGSHPGLLALPSSKSTRAAELESSKFTDGESQGSKGPTGRNVPQDVLCCEDPRVLELQRRCGVILRHCQATSVTASLLTLPTGAGDADGPAPEAAFLAKVASKMNQTNAPHEEPSAPKTANTGEKDAKKKASEVSKETKEEETEASMMAAVAMFRLDMISSDLLKALDGDHVADVVVSPATATTRRLDFENSSSGSTGAAGAGAGASGSPAKSDTPKKSIPLKKAAHLRAQAVAAHHGVLRLLAIHLRSLRRFLRDDSNAALIDAFPAVSTLCPAPPSPIKVPSPIRGVLGKAPATPSGPPVSAEVERALGHPAPSAAAAGSVAVAQEDALATGRMAVPHLINALLCLAK